VQAPFPDPTKIANRNFWSKRAVRCWRAEIAGEPPPPSQIDDEVFLSAAQVKALFGGVSDMWIWRKLKRNTATEEAAAR